MRDRLFINREEAGGLLAEKLEKYRGTDAIILAVPRGGVTIGYEIAKKLELPLDIVLSKKIGHPENEEFAVGSVSLDSAIVNKYAGMPKGYIEKEITRIRKELKQKYALFMGDRQPIDITNKTIIVVDDGIATGSTLLATIDMLRKNNPAKLVIAVPVVPQSNVGIINMSADEFIYLSAPAHFSGVGGFYENFEQVSDEEVVHMLNEINKVNHEH